MTGVAIRTYLTNLSRDSLHTRPNWFPFKTELLKQTTHNRPAETDHVYNRPVHNGSANWSVLNGDWPNQRS